MPHRSTIEGYVGCPVNFQMASLKNDSAIYDLLVTPSASFFQTFNGTLIPLPGAVFFVLLSALCNTWD